MKSMLILGVYISEGREGEVLELSQINDIKRGELPRDARNVITVISIIIIIIIVIMPSSSPSLEKFCQPFLQFHIKYRTCKIH
jgi:hypothetical protein